MISVFCTLPKIAPKIGYDLYKCAVLSQAHFEKKKIDIPYATSLFAEYFQYEKISERFCVGITFQKFAATWMVALCVHTQKLNHLHCRRVMHLYLTQKNSLVLLPIVGKGVCIKMSREIPRTDKYTCEKCLHHTLKLFKN